MIEQDNSQATITSVEPGALQRNEVGKMSSWQDTWRVKLTGFVEIWLDRELVAEERLSAGVSLRAGTIGQLDSLFHLGVNQLRTAVKKSLQGPCIYWISFPVLASRSAFCMAPPRVIGDSLISKRSAMASCQLCVPTLISKLSTSYNVGDTSFVYYRKHAMRKALNSLFHKRDDDDDDKGGDNRDNHDSPKISSPQKLKTFPIGIKQVASTEDAVVE